MISVLQTMRIEGGAAEGTSQGKTKRISKVVLRLFENKFFLSLVLLF